MEGREIRGERRGGPSVELLGGWRRQGACGEMSAPADPSVPVVAAECFRTSVSSSGCCTYCTVVLLRAPLTPYLQRHLSHLQVPSGLSSQSTASKSAGGRATSRRAALPEPRN